MESAESHSLPQKPAPVASARHAVITVLILLLLAALGYISQRAGHARALASEQRHGRLPLYLTTFTAEWALVAYVIFGIRRRAVRLRELIGGRWASAKDVWLDCGVAAAFWGVAAVVLLFVQKLMGGPAIDPKALRLLLPQGGLEIAAFAALSLTAGFCEEVVFRGYLQRQALALTGSAVAAVILQGVVFGISHGYQGLKSVLTISVYGVLFGALAQWRKSLRPGMVAHAWTDIFSGIISGFLTRRI